MGPLGRVADNGTVVSMTSPSQYIVSSVVGLPSIHWAPTYSPPASTRCTRLVARASVIRWGSAREW